jgi:hypothetical protein
MMKGRLAPGPVRRLSETKALAFGGFIACLNADFDKSGLADFAMFGQNWRQ